MAMVDITLCADEGLLKKARELARTRGTLNELARTCLRTLIAEPRGGQATDELIDLMRHEGEGFTREMVERGTLERLVPVLMTALATGIALVPLVFAADAPGKEILHPIAVVIVGGLATSTLLGLGVTPAMFYAFGRKAAEKAVALKAPASG